MYMYSVCRTSNRKLVNNIILTEIWIYSFVIIIFISLKASKCSWAGFWRWLPSNEITWLWIIHSLRTLLTELHHFWPHLIQLSKLLVPQRSIVMQLLYLLVQQLLFIFKECWKLGGFSKGQLLIVWKANTNLLNNKYGGAKSISTPCHAPWAMF